MPCDVICWCISTCCCVVKGWQRDDVLNDITIRTSWKYDMGKCVDASPLVVCDGSEKHIQTLFFYSSSLRNGDEHESTMAGQWNCCSNELFLCPLMMLSLLLLLWQQPLHTCFAVFFIVSHSFHLFSMDNADWHWPATASMLGTVVFFLTLFLKTMHC